MTDGAGEAACTCRRGTLAIGRAACMHDNHFAAATALAPPVACPPVACPALAGRRLHGRIILREGEDKAQPPLSPVTLPCQCQDVPACRHWPPAGAQHVVHWVGPGSSMAGRGPQTCPAPICTGNAVCFPEEACCTRPRQSRCRLDWATRGMPTTSHEHVCSLNTWVLPSYRVSQALDSVRLCP